MKGLRLGLSLTGASSAGVTEHRIVFAGDSITGNMSTSGASLFHYTNGFANWAQVLTDQRAYLPQGGNKGVSGDRINHLHTRYADVLALDPTIVHLLIGTNDISDVTDATTRDSVVANYQTKMTSLIAQNSAAGAHTIICKILPRSSSASPMTAFRVQAWEQMNDWLEAQASSSVTVYDCESVVGNLDANHSMLDGHSTSADYLHPNTTAAYKIGKELQTVIEGLVAERDVFEGVTFLNTGANMAGTGGSKVTATGTVATGWTLLSNSAGGATVVGSKVTSDSGVADIQQIVVSGTYTGTGRNISLQRTLTPAEAGSPVIGDKVEVFAEIEVDAGVTAVAYAAVRSTGPFTLLIHTSEVGGTLTSEAYHGVIRSMPFTLTADMAVSANFGINITLKDTGTTDPCSMTLRVVRCGWRKV